MAPRFRTSTVPPWSRRRIGAPSRARVVGAPPPPRHRLGVLLAVALVLATAMITSIEPAAAHGDGSGPATPANIGAGGHWWASNGCGSVGSTWVPDRLSGTFDFHHPCIHHDGCYRYRFLTRAGCDDRFHRDMRASCEVGAPWTTWFTRPTCRWLADVYAQAVRLFGASSYG